MLADPHARPGPANHASAFCLHGFAWSGHFVEVESCSVWLSVSGFCHATSCPPGPPGAVAESGCPSFFRLSNTPPRAQDAARICLSADSLACVPIALGGGCFAGNVSCEAGAASASPATRVCISPSLPAAERRAAPVPPATEARGDAFHSLSRDSGGSAAAGAATSVRLARGEGVQPQHPHPVPLSFHAAVALGNPQGPRRGGRQTGARLPVAMGTGPTPSSPPETKFSALPESGATGQPPISASAPCLLPLPCPGARLPGRKGEASGLGPPSQVPSHPPGGAAPQGSAHTPRGRHGDTRTAARGAPARTALHVGCEADLFSL